MKQIKYAIIKERDSNKEIGFAKEISFPNTKKNVGRIELNGHYIIESIGVNDLNKFNK